MKTRIENFRIYDLAESVVASGLPFVSDYSAEKFSETVKAVKEQMEYDKYKDALDAPPSESSRALKRASRLAHCFSADGHDNFLSGIIFSANVTASNVWWLEFGRYHFAQIVSSQSKMHMLKEICDNGCFADGVSFQASADNEENVYNCPLGLLLTARITTNYRQLKTIYRQRQHHRLEEWRSFCSELLKLPYSNWICD